MTEPDIGGVVLAAGASRRMGRPKALLPTPGATPLATHQANLLAHAGCTRIAIVVGDPSVAAALADARVRVHPDWQQGRLSSLQAGLRALGPCRGGVVVLPVDTVGVSPAVLRQLAAPTDADAVRPMHQGERGQVVRLSPACVQRILTLPADPNTRLDRWLDARTREVEVDEDVGANVNTPAEWEAARHRIHEELV